MTVFEFGELPKKHGLPKVEVVARVTSHAFSRTPTIRQPGKELLEANDRWPSDDPQVIALAKTTTSGKKTRNDKVDAILAWLRPGRNLRYAGQVVGSRYGVKKVLQQKFGHCWDFSDCFIALCRAAGIPCRQVAGWLYGMSGHVWAEVLIEGEGWRQVDPTGNSECDSRYIPYLVSENGELPLVYTSDVKIRIVE